MIPLLIAGGAALAGALANRGQKQTQMPKLPTELEPIQNLLVRTIQDRLTKGSALPAGYETGQIGNINRTYDLVGQSQRNNLTARGLGTSPVAGLVDSRRDLGRAGDIVQMQASLPLLERQLRDQDMTLAQALLNSGRGVTTTQQGNPWGGGATSLMSMLAYLYGQDAFGQGGGNGGSLPSRPMTNGMPLQMPW